MDVRELRTVFVLANAFKEGDLQVGGTRDERVREDARRLLCATTISDIRRTVLLEDGVSAALDRSRSRDKDADLDALTIGEMRDVLLGRDGPAWAAAHRDALPSDVIAAVARVMTDEDLASVSGRLFNAMPGDGVSIGAASHFGSRIQPNSPGDDDSEILLSILEGLTHGCGDVIIGLNPAADELDTIIRLEALLESVVRRLRLPTRYCVLSDIVKQHRIRERVRVEVGFQSLAGTSRALTGMVGLDVDGVLDLARAFDGLYFETGQGSAVTNGAAEGIDMVTLESRAYGVARHIQRATGSWMIVNDVAGFIGPEVFRTPEQLERACLEDMVMAKLHGITMGLDVCATFHMGISPDALRRVTERIVERAAPAYLMAVAGHADAMLGYLTTSFAEHHGLRTRSRRRMTTAMQRRLIALGAVDSAGAPRPSSAPALYAAYAAAGGDRRALATLEDEGRRRIGEFTARRAPIDALYANARAALYAAIDEGVVAAACPRHLRVRTLATDRETYLSHPPAGERLRDEDASALANLHPLRRPEVQLVVSDGLNANAVSEQLRGILPPLRRLLGEAGVEVSDTDVVVRNGRVRAGYHVGQLVDATAIVHILGERPGTGLGTVSAYLTYGRDAAGVSRWQPGLDHSCTTAVCSIHPRGKPPAVAVDEIGRIIRRILEQRRSGVELQA
jgi:ethanolamine ammonia-lyase large subunit